MKSQEEVKAMLEPMVQWSFKSMQAGTLKKNIVRHFTNKGFTLSISTAIMEMADIRLENFRHYKNK